MENVLIEEMPLIEPVGIILEREIFEDEEIQHNERKGDEMPTNEFSTCIHSCKTTT